MADSSGKSRMDPEIRSSPGGEKRKTDHERDPPTSAKTTEATEPKKIKLSIGLGNKLPTKTPAAPISIKLGAQVKPKEVPSLPVPKASGSVAKAFNQDDEDDDEEMPPEARMRMRNIGRDTPTSAGPNSFGKTRQGFCDVKKMFEKNLKQQMDSINNPENDQ